MAGAKLICQKFCNDNNINFWRVPVPVCRKSTLASGSTHCPSLSPKVLSSTQEMTQEENSVPNTLTSNYTATVENNEDIAHEPTRVLNDVGPANSTFKPSNLELHQPVQQEINIRNLHKPEEKNITRNCDGEHKEDTNIGLDNLGLPAEVLKQVSTMLSGSGTHPKGCVLLIESSTKEGNKKSVAIRDSRGLTVKCVGDQVQDSSLKHYTAQGALSSPFTAKRPVPISSMRSSLSFVSAGDGLALGSVASKVINHSVNQHNMKDCKKFPKSSHVIFYPNNPDVMTQLYKSGEAGENEDSLCVNMDADSDEFLYPVLRIIKSVRKLLNTFKSISESSWQVVVCSKDGYCDGAIKTTANLLYIVLGVCGFIYPFDYIVKPEILEKFSAMPKPMLHLWSSVDQGEYGYLPKRKGVSKAGTLRTSLYVEEYNVDTPITLEQDSLHHYSIHDPSEALNETCEAVKQIVTTQQESVLNENSNITPRSTISSHNSELGENLGSISSDFELVTKLLDGCSGSFEETNASLTRLDEVCEISADDTNTKTLLTSLTCLDELIEMKSPSGTSSVMLDDSNTEESKHSKCVSLGNKQGSDTCNTNSKTYCGGANVLETSAGESDDAITRCVSSVEPDPGNARIVASKEITKLFCEFCAESFINVLTKEQHLRECHSEKLCKDDNNVYSFKCEICNSKFRALVILYVHRCREHNWTLPWIVPRYYCGICLYVHSNFTQVRTHYERIHCEDRNHMCDLCGHCFKTYQTLFHHVANVHQKKHCPCCEVCGKILFSKTSLRYHMYTHTGEKPFSCGECDYRSATRGNLKVHMQLHHGKVLEPLIPPPKSPRISTRVVKHSPRKKRKLDS